MHTPDGLRDLHERTHRKLADLIQHCDALGAEKLHRVVDGFGDGTVQLQLHHAITAERYWVGVIQGQLILDEDADQFSDSTALESLRSEVFTVTDGYLARSSPEELNTPRAMTLFDGTTRELSPAHVVLRTITHIYHHMGQVAAMCRLLGHPVLRGVNYPILG